MKCTVHDLGVMGSNPSRVELKVHSPSVNVILEPKTYSIQCVQITNDSHQATTEMDSQPGDRRWPFSGF